MSPAYSGYMAPESIMYGEFSEKSDIFSFGVMILEIISGKRNGSTEPQLLSHVSILNLILYLPLIIHILNTAISKALFN